MTKHARFFLLPSFILISAALIAGCNDKGEEKAHVGEPQVTVHIVKTAPLEVKTELPGQHPCKYRSSNKKVCHVRLPYFDAVSAGVSVVALTCSPGRAFCRPLTMT